MLIIPAYWGKGSKRGVPSYTPLPNEKAERGARGDTPLILPL
jgi:hypothetical protein